MTTNHLPTSYSFARSLDLAILEVIKMNGQIRDIPGFFYGIKTHQCFTLYLYPYLMPGKDKVKKKYFKIQASSAGPAGAAYSSQDIKRRKLEDERTEALALGMAQQKGRIQISSGLWKSPLGGLLPTEKVHSRLNAAHTLTAGLVEQGCFHNPESIPPHYSPLFDVEPRPDIDSSRVDIRIGKFRSTVCHSATCPLNPQPTATQYRRTINKVFKANCPTVADSYFTVCANIDDATHRYGDVMSNRRQGLKVGDIFLNNEYFGDPGESTSLSINKAHRMAGRTWLTNTSHAGMSICSTASSREESYGRKFTSSQPH